MEPSKRGREETKSKDRNMREERKTKSKFSKR